MIAHIYLLKNKINDKCYIGYTTQLERRTLYYKNVKRNRPIEVAIRELGYENFEFTVIYCSKDIKHTLIEMEQYFIEKYDSIKNGYNICLGGRDGSLTTEIIEQISNKLKGRKFSKEWYKKQSIAQKLSYKNRTTWLKGLEPDKHPSSKTWLAVSPEGEKIYIKSIRFLCIKYNLSRRTIANTLYTKKPVRQSWKHRNCIGWQLFRIEE